VDDEHAEPPSEFRCASCFAFLVGYDVGRPVCTRCDGRLERAIQTFLAYVEACRGDPPRATR